MAKTLKVAIIGLGYWGPNWLRNFSQLSDMEIAYGCDLNADRLKKFRRQYPAIMFTNNVKEVFRDKSVDGVVIATPTSTHFPLAKAALNAGKHVLLEKPMASTSSEAAKLMALARANHRVLLVDHTFAYTDAVRKIRELVKRGKLGQLLYFDSTRINLGLIQKDTSVFHDLAVHDLTILGQIADLHTITEVLATGASHFGKTVEAGHLHLKFRSGLTAHIAVSWLSPVKIRSTIIGGRKAMVVFDDLEPSEKIRIYDKGVDHDSTKPDPFYPKYRSGDVLIPALTITEALLRQAQHFAACIRGKERPHVGGEDGRLVLKILELAQKSMRTGKAVKVQKL